MNKTYRSVWNESTGTWVAVQENAKGRKKKSRSALILPVLNAVAATAALVGASSAHAGYGDSAGGGATGSNNGSGFAIGLNAYAENGYAMGGNVTTTGNYSIGIGYTAMTNGANAIAMGGYSTAVAQNAIAIGSNSYSAYQDTVAIGVATKTNGLDAVALGSSALANSQNATAIGYASTANGVGAVSLGMTSYVNGANAMALGSNATATGASSMAIGTGAVSNAPSTTVFGVNASAASGATNAIAIGYQSVADRSNTMSVGSASQQRQIEYVAAGTSDTDAVNLGQLNAVSNNLNNIANGGGIKYFHANSTQGDSVASGTDSLAVGPTATASGQAASALGYGAQASALGAAAVGLYANAAGSSAVAIGSSASAATANSVALGANSLANSTTLGSAGFAPVGGTAISASTAAGGEVSVGKAGAERRITNVAAGLNGTDAVNVSQMMSEDAKVNHVSNNLSNLSNTVNNINTATGNITNISNTINNITNGSPFCVYLSASSWCRASPCIAVRAGSLMRRVILRRGVPRRTQQIYSCGPVRRLAIRSFAPASFSASSGPRCNATPTARMSPIARCDVRDVIGEKMSVSSSTFANSPIDAIRASGEFPCVTAITFAPAASADFAASMMSRVRPVFEIATTTSPSPSKPADIKNVCGSE